MFKPGDLIGEYQLERPLGEGGLGVAWLARRVDRPGAVALKLIRPDRVPATARGAAYDQVSRALTAVGRLEHDSLQPVLGTALGGDGVFGVAAQYLEGGPFERIGDLGRRDVLVQALALVRQLAEVLAWLHSRGLVHGNVKPQNALVTPSAAGPRLVLLDLAWSRAGLGRRTEATRAYVSPEQLTKQPPTFASDQWATARILHQLAMQAAPGASQTQALTALPLPVLRVMKRALEQDPKARFASMESFVQALEFAEEELGSGGSSAHALPTPTLDMLRKAEDVTDRHLPPPRAATPGHPVSVLTPAGADLPQAPSTLNREAPTEPGMLRPAEVREAAVDPSLEQGDPTTPLSVQAINPSADRGGSLGDAELVREAPIKPTD
ncbi:MAG: protein kinase, partial [Myxococcales bacterium]|nr:protein kinase [Myxococcales bacterium]